ncbi:hypothetical protein N7462_011606 [Penicillium macrosclerotiorum]|uniref:uncharacterized protein n=1 Tax=Penicillium macrosclerotiorum TaxID=303699 RepID=UPI0025474220|nr:uncharacterized protein N7462_011606 [Penicillium macrosclerotiorum]KAJ5662680.1 hypothetical protein N7462_011606 [Penicillium macrosclerotiorum]
MKQRIPYYPETGTSCITDSTGTAHMPMKSIPKQPDWPESGAAESRVRYYQHAHWSVVIAARAPSRMWMAVQEGKRGAAAKTLRAIARSPLRAGLNPKRCDTAVSWTDVEERQGGVPRNGGAEIESGGAGKH